MKSMLRTVDDHGVIYTALMFVCPGCLEMYPGSTGLHMLPVNSPHHQPSWEWDRNLEAVTLSPSILTRHNQKVDEQGNVVYVDVCHSFLKAGVFQFLGDCTHKYANQKVPMIDLPQWVEDDA